MKGSEGGKFVIGRAKDPGCVENVLCGRLKVPPLTGISGASGLEKVASGRLKVVGGRSNAPGVRAGSFVATDVSAGAAKSSKANMTIRRVK
jgi:hypothetical protein